jgi:hypothetical protein
MTLISEINFVALHATTQVQQNSALQRLSQAYSNFLG